MTEVEAIAEVLELHAMGFEERPNAEDPTLLDYGTTCTCGGWNALNDGGRHLDHAAEQIAARLAAADRDTALREALERVNDVREYGERGTPFRNGADMLANRVRAALDQSSETRRGHRE